MYELSERNKKDMTILKECPTGYVLRNAPHIYAVIKAYNYIESGSINPMDQSSWAQAAFNVIGSEKARLYELEQNKNQTRRDSEYGRRALNHG